MFVMKIPKEDYPLLATLFNTGVATGVIATKYGCTPNYISDLKSEFRKKGIIYDNSNIDISDVGKVIVAELAFSADKDAVRLQASKALMDLATGSGETQATKDTAKIRVEILSELNELQT